MASIVVSDLVLGGRVELLVIAENGFVVDLDLVEDVFVLCGVVKFGKDVFCGLIWWPAVCWGH